MPITTLPPAPNKISDTPDEFSLKADAWVAALEDFVTEANVLGNEVTSSEAIAVAAAGDAAADAAAAAASAVTAFNAPGTSGSSSDSRTINVGTKVLTVETGKSLVVGMPVVIAATAAPTNYMYGIITAYDSGTGLLTVSVEYISGTGTYAAWTVSLTGPRQLSLGVEQTWTDMAASRNLATDYTNSTGRPIMVAVILYMTPKTSSLTGGELLINGTTIVKAEQQGEVDEPGRYETLTALVPAGATYRVNGIGTGAKSAWMELR